LLSSVKEAYLSSPGCEQEQRIRVMEIKIKIILGIKKASVKSFEIKLYLRRH
jgi:hypothetical protein